MLAALQTGVKGGKWHSLMDKVSRLETLSLGWAQVARNAGAAGVDRMSPDGHPKLLHLWPPKLPQAGRLNYQLFGLAGSDFLSW